MNSKINRRTFVALTSAAALTPPAFADGHAAAVVEMLNQNPDNPRERMVFHPRITVVEPGQTVLFQAVDPGHNSEAIEDMVPEGTELWEGRIGDDVEATFETPGVYGYKCTPHASVGMVGLIVVKGDGMFDNLEAAKDVRQRGRAAAVWDDIWEELDGMDLS